MLYGSFLFFFQANLVLVGLGGLVEVSLATVGVWESGAQQGLGRLVMWWQEVTGERESGELESGGETTE